MALHRLFATLVVALGIGAAAPVLIAADLAVAKDSDSGGDSDNSGRGGGDDDGGHDDGDDDGDDHGRGHDDDRSGRSSGEGSRGTWRSSSKNAREAVSGGQAAPLSAVLPMVFAAVPGRLLDVDLRQSSSGAWLYELVVLTQDRKYREVTVDARSKRILRIRSR
jgi:uncharacterized membrane protein YkoI